MLSELEFEEWLRYRQEAINKRVPITKPITEPMLLYESLTESEKLNFDKQARQYYFSHPHPGQRQINPQQLRTKYYWEVFVNDGE